MHDAGVQKNILELGGCGNSDNLEESDGVPKGATSSFASSPHEGNKGERGMYKTGSKHIPFDFVKHRKIISCSFHGLDNHYVSRCSKRMATYRKLLKEKKQEAKGPQDKENPVVKRMHLCYTYYHKQGHLVERCWTLNPVLLPPKLNEKVEKYNSRVGNKDSMIDGVQDDSHIDANVQTKEGPL